MKQIESLLFRRRGRRPDRWPVAGAFRRPAGRATAEAASRRWSIDMDRWCSGYAADLARRACGAGRLSGGVPDPGCVVRGRSPTANRSAVGCTASRMRVASKARVAASRRRVPRARGGEIAADRGAGSPGGSECGEERWAELLEELARLPEAFRAAVVLCYLEGQTQEQAAAHLRWPLGTVQSRLARGRATLKARLERRGLAPSLGLLGPLAAPRDPGRSGRLGRGYAPARDALGPTRTAAVGAGRSRWGRAGRGSRSRHDRPEAEDRLGPRDSRRTRSRASGLAGSAGPPDREPPGSDGRPGSTR